jgi:Fe-S oxidoreductase
MLREIIGALRSEIRAGTPVVGLEPSCVAVFRDELLNLFPNDEDAIRLSKQTYLLSEFLRQKASAFKLPKLHRQATVHAHCHHSAVMKFNAEQAVLEDLSLDYDILKSGCCGMAGSFGFEPSKYDVSIACGERVLLPAIRHAGKDTLIIANGFSCREQIMQETDPHAMHLAEVIQLALEHGPRGPEGNFPERAYAPVTHKMPFWKFATLLGLSALASASLIKLNRKYEVRRHHNR